MKNPFKKNKDGKEKEEIEAQLALASSMKKLAETIERATDPIRWQKMITDALFGLADVAHPGLQEALARAVPGGEETVRAIAVSISLTDEERDRLSGVVFEALKPQLDDLVKFTETALKDMPAHRLKELAKKIEAGAKPTLRRERGCVYVDIEGEPGGTYLNL